MTVRLQVKLQLSFTHCSTVGQTQKISINEKKLPSFFSIDKNSIFFPSCFFLPFVRFPSCFPSKFFHHFGFSIKTSLQVFSPFWVFHQKFLPRFFTIFNFPSKFPSRLFLHFGLSIKSSFQVFSPFSISHQNFLLRIFSICHKSTFLKIVTEF